MAQMSLSYRPKAPEPEALPAVVKPLQQPVKLETPELPVEAYLSNAILQYQSVHAEIYRLEKLREQLQAEYRSLSTKFVDTELAATTVDYRVAAALSNVELLKQRSAREDAEIQAMYGALLASMSQNEWLQGNVAEKRAAVEAAKRELSRFESELSAAFAGINGDKIQSSALHGMGSVFGVLNSNRDLQTAFRRAQYAQLSLQLRKRELIRDLPCAAREGFQ